MNRFSGQGLYILDEPEAALSPMRQLSMLIRMHELAEQGSQFVIATHSPILMAYPESTIYSLTQEGIHESALEDTEHYQTTKLFFENRDRLFHHLFNSKRSSDCCCFYSASINNATPIPPPTHREAIPFLTRVFLIHELNLP